MTTSDTGIIEEPRSIDVLLKCNTYQGMTDEEIQRLIDWYKDTAYKDALNDASLELLKENHEELMQRINDIADKSEAAFNTAVASTVKFQTVGGDA